jgi:zinc transport system ATP-binding protein
VSTPLIQLDRASVGYDGQAVVSGLDLSVHPGEALALVGPNGSGKTTLVQAILGLAEVTAGSLLVFAHRPASHADRGRIGYVPQRPPLGGIVPTTVGEVVTAGRLARGGWLRSRASDRAAVRHALDRVGLADLSSVRVDTLSGGQQRRVLIARALAAEPEMLVLDEPLAGVDRSSQEQLAETLRVLLTDGTTLVVVLHELGPMRQLISRIARLRDGRLVYDGPVTTDVLADLHEDELGHHDHHHDDDPGGGAKRPPTGGRPLGLTG